MKINNDNLRNKGVLIGHGTTAKIYKINDNKIYKEFLSPIEVLGERYKRYLEISNINLDHIMSVENICIDESNKNCLKMIGYISSYVNGICINKIDGNESFNDILNKIIILEKEIAYLTKDKKNQISIGDLWIENIMYNENGIYLIDTDEWRLVDDENKNIDVWNTYCFNREFINGILPDNDILLFRHFSNYHSYELKESFMKAFKQGLLSLSNFLIMYVDELSYYSDKKIDTLDDFRNASLKLKKTF